MPAQSESNSARSCIQRVPLHRCQNEFLIDLRRFDVHRHSRRQLMSDRSSCAWTPAIARAPQVCSARPAVTVLRCCARRRRETAVGVKRAVADEEAGAAFTAATGGLDFEVSTCESANEASTLEEKLVQRHSRRIAIRQMAAVLLRSSSGRRCCRIVNRQHQSQHAV